MIREKLGYLTTTEAHKIGILYIVLAVIDLMLAGVMALIIRLTIATTPPATNVGSVGLITGDVHCWVMSLHGMSMLLLFAMQAVTGLANVAVPKLIGAPDLLA
jgi:heme/copper-type cytochrome/quinol oxidase subunit 1